MAVSWKVTVLPAGRVALVLLGDGGLPFTAVMAFCRLGVGVGVGAVVTFRLTSAQGPDVVVGAGWMQATLAFASVPKAALVFTVASRANPDELGVP